VRAVTESAWWAATDPDPMLDWLAGSPGAATRKRLLFAGACCRRIIPKLSEPRFRGWAAVVDLLTSEQHFGAESSGAASGGEDFLAGVSDELADPDTWTLFGAFHDTRLGWFDVSAQVRAALATSAPTHFDELDALLGSEPLAHCALLHELFGPLPFRDIAVHFSWLTSDVVALARGIDDGKAFDRMPILADALQDAGCDNDDILNHCRATRWEHLRGCWVIDLLLGRPWRE
jgi:hypothetical protein